MLLANRVSARSFRLIMAATSFLMMLYVWTDSQLSRRYSAKALICAKGDQVTFDHSGVEGVGRDDFLVTDYLRGPPTNSLFDNLRNDTLYITTFLTAGFTNDMQAIVNMIYLAMLTGRVPIIPPHTPRHVNFEAGTFPFGDVFDLPRLRKELHYPVIEWKDVKAGIGLDYIGCWSQGMASDLAGRHPHHTDSQFGLHLDPSYTAVPSNSRIANGFHSFSHFARLAYPEGREEAIRDQTPLSSPLHKKVLFPDSHIMCFDCMYYVGNSDAFEWEKEWSPAWKLVGQYLHWHPKMLRLAQQYAKNALGVAEDAPLPKFVSVHLRRGDFRQYCGEILETCFPPVEEVARVVKDVQAQVFANLGVQLLPEHVIVTSDESNPSWWSSIRSQGWTYVDHTAERTEDHFGFWYPTFIDAIIHSLGTGFVGTEGSTMSLVAGRRVEDWNGGVVKMVVDPIRREPLSRILGYVSQ